MEFSPEERVLQRNHIHNSSSGHSVTVLSEVSRFKTSSSLVYYITRISNRQSQRKTQKETKPKKQIFKEKPNKQANKI